MQRELHPSVTGSQSVTSTFSLPGTLGEQQPATPAPATAARSECQLSVTACEQGRNWAVTKAQSPLHPEVSPSSFWHIPRVHFFQEASA